MSKRPFNKDAYDKYDSPPKKRLVELMQRRRNYELASDLKIEMYKKGDVLFIKNGDEKILFENEVRKDFDRIVNEFSTVHIPIRKRNTPANFYLVWSRDLNYFILINKETLNKYRDTIVEVYCNHEDNQNEAYTEEFVDIPKKETELYLISQGFKLIKLEYD